MAMGWIDGLFETSSAETVKTMLSAISPAQWCQAFYVLTAAAVLITAAVPREARSLLADYGARKAPNQDGQQPSRKSQDWLVSLVAAITSWGQIPHSWFSAFYGLSIACSLFWLAQFLVHGSVLRLIASRQAETPAPSPALVQVAAAWAMLFLQGSRRIYEHVAIMRPSKSTMWFVHWLLGLGFYLFLSVSVWVEGSSMLRVVPMV